MGSSEEGKAGEITRYVSAAELNYSTTSIAKSGVDWTPKRRNKWINSFAQTGFQ